MYPKFIIVTVLVWNSMVTTLAIGQEKQSYVADEVLPGNSTRNPQFYSTCGSIVNQNQTFFRNPDYPNNYRPASGSDVCQIRIRRQVGICQLRLNFLKFKIDGPLTATSTGQHGSTAVEAGSCKTDVMTIPGQQTGATSLCGNMGGQHLYLDFGHSDTITINIVLSQKAMIDRQWNIEIQMIPCSSVLRAPSGCLQYFQGLVGRVESFNNARGTHLSNLGYSICVRVEEGMKSIDWSACNPGEVKLSGPTPLPVTQANTPQPCSTINVHDYLTIPGGVFYPLPTIASHPSQTTFPRGESQFDRFCDVYFGYANSFVRTSVKPFVVAVRTDNTELPPITGNAAYNDASTGFCLKWRQSPH